MPGLPWLRRARRRHLALAALGLLSPLVGARATVARPAAPGSGPQVKIQPAVVAIVASGDRAPVLVLLRVDAPASADDDTFSATVERVQDAVTTSLPGGAFRVTHRYTLVPALGGEVTPRGLKALAADPRVAAVELAVEDVAFLAEHVGVVHGREAWGAYGLTGEGVTVAVLDTGIDTDHPDLEDDIVAQQCYSQAGGCGGNNATRGPSAEDEAGHGTSVSGIITSGGVVSAPGIAPDAGIAAIRVFNDRVTADTRDIVKGLDWVLGNRNRYNIKVVNMSLGSTTTYKGNCDAQDQTRATAVDQLVRRGVTVVAASGNGASNNGMSSPACLSRVLAVGASYDADFPRSPAQGTFGGGCFDEDTTPAMVACFSNVSRSLDVVAPGVWTTAPKMGGGTATTAGTSNASPMTAGIAALLYQAKPNLRPAQIEGILKASAAAARHPATGLEFPRVDALAAVAAVVPATLTPGTGPTAATTASATATSTASATTPASPAPRASQTPAATKTPTAAGGASPTAVPAETTTRVFLPAAHKGGG